MSLLEITGLTHSFGENLLYKNAGFTLNKGEHIGIVGQNGTGKSTLIKICTEQIIPDSGRVIWQPNITIGYLDQYAEIDHTLTMKEFLKSAFAKLFEIETQVMQLYEKAADGDMKNLELAACYQEQLETHDFYSIDIRAAKRAEAAYDRRMYRYKAYYSLDCDNGIENAILMKPQTPEMLLEEKQFQEQVYAAVMKLPEKQAKRIYARYYLGMTVNEIAEVEGVDPSRVRDSIRRGLKQLVKYF